MKFGAFLATALAAALLPAVAAQANSYVWVDTTSLGGYNSEIWCQSKVPDSNHRLETNGTIEYYWTAYDQYWNLLVAVGIVEIGSSGIYSKKYYSKCGKDTYIEVGPFADAAAHDTDVALWLDATGTGTYVARVWNYSTSQYSSSSSMTIDSARDYSNIKYAEAMVESSGCSTSAGTGGDWHPFYNAQKYWYGTNPGWKAMPSVSSAVTGASSCSPSGDGYSSGTLENYGTLWLKTDL